MNEKKFYQKVWFMWICLIFYAPVGIFLLWKYHGYNKKLKVISSVVFGFILLVATVITIFENKAETELALNETEQNETISNESSLNPLSQAKDAEIVVTKPIAEEVKEVIPAPVDDTNKIIENVNTLIEGLNTDSSRTDYEMAQSAYDSLSSSQKRKISKEYTNILAEINYSTMSIEEAVDYAIEKTNAIKDDNTLKGSVRINDHYETGDKVILIYLKGKESLTGNSNSIKKSMLLDANNILHFLQRYNNISEICIFWSFSLVDVYGNTYDDNVMKVLFEKPTLDKINFENLNFDFNNIPKVADSYYEHPLFSK